MKEMILKRFVEIYNAMSSPHVALRLHEKGYLEAKFTYNGVKGFQRGASLESSEKLLDRMLAEPNEVPRLILLQEDHTFNKLLCQAYMEVYHG